MSNFCIHCGGALLPQARFCNRCGNVAPGPVSAASRPAAPPPAVAWCGSCRSPLAPAARFCIRCGGRAAQAAPVAAAGASPPSPAPAATPQPRAASAGVKVGVAAAVLIVALVAAVVGWQTLRPGPASHDPPNSAAPAGRTARDAPARDAPTAATPRRDAPRGTAASQGAGAAKRPPSAFAADLPPARAARAPAPPPSGRTIRSVQIRPDAKAQSIACGDRVTVVVPGGALDAPAELVVAEATGTPPGPWADTTPLAALDVRLGDRHVFPAPLQVEIPFDPASVPAGMDPQQSVVAASWRPDVGRWVALPVQVDAKARRARAITPHLSLLGFWTRGVQYLRYDSVKTENFVLWYDRAGLQNSITHNDAVWDTFCQADAADPLEYRRQTVHAPGVPHFIEYVGQALEYVRTRFEGSRFPLPRWTRTDVFVNVGSVYQDPNRTAVTGVIYLPLAYLAGPREVRTVVAHEYFHEVEANLLGLGIMSMNYRRWWVEALAEYAERFVWGDAAELRAMTPSFLRLPLHTQDDEHEYAAAHFVRFLVEDAAPARRISFRDLVNGTLTVPVSILSLEEMNVVNVALFQNALGITEPFDDYRYGVTVLMLERLYAARNADFRQLYLEFAVRMLLDGRATELVPNPQAFEAFVTAQWGAPEVLGTDRQAVPMEFALPPGYSTAVRAIRVQVAGGADAERVCELAASNMPPGGAVAAFRLPGFVRPNDIQGAILLDTSAEANRRELTCDPGDVLFVLGVGRRARDSVFTARLEGATRGLRTVRMRDEALWTADITGYFVGDELVEKHGLSTVYYDKAGKQVAKRITYARGVQHGPCTYYYRNGVINEQGQMANGKRQGRFVLWDEDGTKSRESEYSAGVLEHEVGFRSERKVIEVFYRNGKRVRTVTYDAEGKVLGEDQY